MHFLRRSFSLTLRCICLVRFPVCTFLLVFTGVLHRWCHVLSISWGNSASPYEQEWGTVYVQHTFPNQRILQRKQRVSPNFCYFVSAWLHSISMLLRIMHLVSLFSLFVLPCQATDPFWDCSTLPPCNFSVASCKFALSQCSDIGFSYPVSLPFPFWKQIYLFVKSLLFFDSFLYYMMNFSPFSFTPVFYTPPFSCQDPSQVSLLLSCLLFVTLWVEEELLAPALRAYARGRDTYWSMAAYQWPQHLIEWNPLT